MWDKNEGVEEEEEYRHQTPMDNKYMNGTMLLYLHFSKEITCSYSGKCRLQLIDKIEKQENR